MNAKHLLRCAAILWPPTRWREINFRLDWGYDKYGKPRWVYAQR